jgi:hypothetical protein
MQSFLSAAEYQDNPLSKLVEFVKTESANETAGMLEKLRFVGYVLEIGFDTARIITSDPFKRAVGGIPRGSFLIMVPDNLQGMPPHFSLLRVKDVAATPLGSQVQQTYFELHKKSMPELDVWTQGELQWGAFNTTVLGMFYPDPNDTNKLSFSGDVNTVVSAHRYRVYAPTDDLLKLIVNGIVRQEMQSQIGMLRPTECQLPFANVAQHKVPVNISIKDLMGFRTAMFGKTRLGKSNVVKLLADAIIKTTESTKNIGQLIFDINGEYANDNPQDGNLSLRSANESRCTVYSLIKREATPSKPLKLNFYEQPDSSLPIIAGLLDEAGQEAQYVKSFAAVELPNLAEIPKMAPGDKVRAVRKIQIFWAILHKAGFASNQPRLTSLGLKGIGQHSPSHFNPKFRQDLRDAAWQFSGANPTPDEPNDLGTLTRELEVIAAFRQDNPNSQLLQSTGSSGDLFDTDMGALISFLKPKSGGGTNTLRPFLNYHDPNASDVVTEIIGLLDSGQTVILDLGNATDKIRRYFSDLLSKEVFSNQEIKFTSNNLNNSYIQLYFEEAHNLFPRDSKDLTDVYSRFAKEGAKFHIGMVYSTQSPSTISQELLAQTENFFVGHLSSQDEAKSLARVQVAYEGLEQDILQSRTPGYMRMLTFSHRFVIPVQAFKYEAFASTSPTS